MRTSPPTRVVVDGPQNPIERDLGRLDGITVERLERIPEEEPYGPNWAR
jgi:hypothetical protein